MKRIDEQGRTECAEELDDLGKLQDGGKGPN